MLGQMSLVKDASWGQRLFTENIVGPMLSGAGKVSTSVGVPPEMNPTLQIVMVVASAVANRKHSP